MEDVDKIIEKLVKTEELYGILGVFGLLLVVVMFFGFWLFYSKFVEKKAESIFERALAKYKGDLVSEIGQNFLNQTEEIQKNITELKSELNILSGQRSSFLDERRKCLINLHTAYVDWVNTIVDKSVYSIEDGNLNLRKEYIVEFNQLKQKVNIASASYQIFGRDIELNTIFSALLVDATRLQTLKTTQLLKYAHFRVWIARLNKERDDAALNNKSVTGIESDLEMYAKQSLAYVDNSEKEIQDKYKEIVLKQIKVAARISKIIKESFES